MSPRCVGSSTTEPHRVEPSASPAEWRDLRFWATKEPCVRDQKPGYVDHCSQFLHRLIEGRARRLHLITGVTWHAGSAIPLVPHKYRSPPVQGGSGGLMSPGHLLRRQAHQMRASVEHPEQKSQRGDRHRHRDPADVVRQGVLRLFHHVCHSWSSEQGKSDRGASTRTIPPEW